MIFWRSYYCIHHELLDLRQKSSRLLVASDTQKLTDFCLLTNIDRHFLIQYVLFSDSVGENQRAVVDADGS